MVETTPLRLVLNECNFQFNVSFNSNISLSFSFNFNINFRPEITNDQVVQKSRLANSSEEQSIGASFSLNVSASLVLVLILMLVLFSTQVLEQKLPTFRWSRLANTSVDQSIAARRSNSLLAPPC